MNENVKNLWVDALRSGEYSQTKRQLQDDGGYCCLGVLCEVGEKAGIPVNTRPNGKLSGLSLTAQGGILDWSGTGQLDQQNTLIRMNDAGGKTFEEIADYIEDIWEQI